MGEKINLSGIPVEVVSQDEINEQSDKGQMVFACMPTRFGPSAVPGSRVVQCEECKQDVWISPATYSTWQSCAAPIYCIECCMKDVK